MDKNIQLLTLVNGIDLLCEVVSMNDEYITIREGFRLTAGQNGLNGTLFSLIRGDEREFMIHRVAVCGVLSNQELTNVWEQFSTKFKAMKSGIAIPNGNGDKLRLMN